MDVEGQPNSTDVHQVRINLTTTAPELQLPDGQTQLLVPGGMYFYFSVSKT